MTDEDKIAKLAREVMGWGKSPRDDRSVFIVGDSFAIEWNPIESIADAMELADLFPNVTIRKPLWKEPEPHWKDQQYRVGLSYTEHQQFVERTSLCVAIVDAALLAIGVKREDL